MQRTTVMLDESLLQALKQLAHMRQESTSNVIREALAEYIAEQHRATPIENPLLGLVALGATTEPTNVAEGGDEAILRDEIDPVYGWRIADLSYIRSHC